MTKARPAVNQASAVRVRKIAPYLGAEISGVKLTAVDDADFQIIHDAFELGNTK